jgi:hypothetical protein
MKMSCISAFLIRWKIKILFILKCGKVGKTIQNWTDLKHTNGVFHMFRRHEQETLRGSTNLKFCYRLIFDPEAEGDTLLRNVGSQWDWHDALFHKMATIISVCLRKTSTFSYADTAKINKNFCEEPLVYFPFIRHEPHGKRTNSGVTQRHTDNEVIS